MVHKTLHRLQHPTQIMLQEQLKIRRENPNSYLHS